MLMNYQSIITHKTAKDYIKACREARKHTTYDGVIPKEYLAKFQLALRKYHEFLDSINCKMKPAKFPYNKEDMRTWMYINVEHVNSKGTKVKIDIINTKWKYWKTN